MGNLTLLTGRLNAKVSNGPWLGASGKRRGLQKHDVLFLNRDLLEETEASWTDVAIRDPTEKLTAIILQIWPAPAGHKSAFFQEKKRSRHKVDLLDLLNAGVLLGG